MDMCFSGGFVASPQYTNAVNNAEKIPNYMHTGHLLAICGCWVVSASEFCLRILSVLSKNWRNINHKNKKPQE
jgi:hypothetical protein